MRIDAHQHFWKYNPVRDTWMDDSMKILRKDYLPKDLLPLLQHQNVEGCVAVQADQSEAESEFLLKLAEKNNFVKGVVGWVDLNDAKIKERLAHFSENSLFKGVRHILQAEEASYMLTPSFFNGIGALEEFQLTYDILVYAHQLPAVVEFVKAFPNQAFVIDHIAKPEIAQGNIVEWKKHMAEIAKHENVYCKVSGMVTEADWGNWTYDQILPYLEATFEMFGTDRIMYGSDWPVCTLAATYEKQYEVVANFIKDLSDTELSKVWGQNAVKFYNLK